MPLADTVVVNKITVGISDVYCDVTIYTHVYDFT